MRKYLIAAAGIGMIASANGAFAASATSNLNVSVTVSGACVVSAALGGALSWQFYPLMQGSAGVWTLLSAAAFVLLAAFPLIFEAKEALQWRISRSEI